MLTGSPAIWIVVLLAFENETLQIFFCDVRARIASLLLATLRRRKGRKGKETHEGTKRSLSLPDDSIRSSVLVGYVAYEENDEVAR